MIPMAASPGCELGDRDRCPGLEPGQHDPPDAPDLAAKHGRVGSEHGGQDVQGAGRGELEEGLALEVEHERLRVGHRDAGTRLARRPPRRCA